MIEERITNFHAIQNGEIVLPLDSMPLLPPMARPLFDIPTPPSTNPDELLRHAFLCRGGGAMLCGPTGIGKSVFNLQCAIAWALGRPAFGIEPARPLSSLIIQSENDDADLTKMRDDIADGFGLTPSECELVSKRVMIVTEDRRAGVAFFTEVVRPLLEQHRPDLLWIDPVLTYLGGDASSQREVSPWLRNCLTPMIREFGCGAILCHHTNKPASGTQKADWKAGDFAYLGTGSSEFANWARAVLAIRSIGSHTIFELHAGKRGGRLGWSDAEGVKAYHRHIAHTDGRIFWREPDPSEITNGTPGRPKKYSVEDMLKILPPGGMTLADWKKAAAAKKGIGKSSFYVFKKDLEESGKIFELLNGNIAPKP